MVFSYSAVPYFLECINHKVRTYKEYHSLCPSSELGLSQPLSRQRVFPSPLETGGRGHTSLPVHGGLGGVPIPTRGIHCGTLYMYVLCDINVFNNGEVLRLFFIKPVGHFDILQENLQIFC
jgi:hypothetical protein